LKIAIYNPFVPVFNNLIDIFPIQKLFLYLFLTTQQRQMPQASYFYKAFGLVFKSCIEHPEFIVEASTDRPDCTINFGEVPVTLTNPDKIGGVYQNKGNQFLLKVENVGRYLIENGNTITIDKMPAATTRETIIFLWASAMAALLHQRGLLIVHGSTVKIGESAVIFSGRSGSGKSTMASAFSSLDNSLMVSDDISAIRINETGVPVVLPGYPMMKLWRDSSDKFGIEWDKTRYIRENVKKMIVNTRDRFYDQEVGLRQVYLLSYKNSGNAEINEVTGYKKLELLTGKIFRKNYLKKGKTSPFDIFDKASKILPSVRLCTVDRQHGMSFFDETIELIKNDLSQSKIL
jgi:hypothetical protein